MKYKFVIIAPKYLNMSPGKLSSQVAHAASGMTRMLSEKEWNEYRKCPVKYVLSAALPSQLFGLMLDAEHDKKLKTYVFVDYPPTTENTEHHVTALALFGPEKRLSKLTDKFQLY